jgi:hypothetical protein
MEAKGAREVAFLQLWHTDANDTKFLASEATTAGKTNSWNTSRNPGPHAQSLASCRLIVADDIFAAAVYFCV